jgi:hypothetical protein
MKYLKRIFEWVQILINWFGNLAKWFYSGKKFWFFIILIIGLIPFTRLYEYFGVGLQLFGIIAIVIGINKKINFFNHESSIKYHFKGFPRLKPKHHIVNLSGTIHATSSASATLTKGIRKPDQSFLDIIRYIDENLNQLTQQISNTKTDFNNQITVLTKQLNDHKQQLDSSIAEVEKKLVVSNTSDISLELFGAGCLAAGLLFSILPLW